MYALILTLIVLASIVLVLIVLVQNSKGGGLASNFSSSNQIMGVRKTTDFIEKATWGLASFVIVLSILSVSIIKRESTGPAIEINAPAIPASTTTPDVALPNVLGNEQAAPQAPASEQPSNNE